MSEVIKLDPEQPGRAFSRCKDVVSSGGIIVYPTDTFYALGADPNNADALQRLFEIKGRAADQPILLLIKDAKQVWEWADMVSAQAEDLMKKHWPGPLTLVFKAKERVLSGLSGGTGTIGLRVPGSRVTRELLDFVGTALTGTSANVTGQQSMSTAEEAVKAIGGRVDLILDGGATPGGSPSTVVDVTGRVRVIRRGAVQIAEFGIRNSE